MWVQKINKTFCVNLKSIANDLIIKCDEIIITVAKSYNKPTKVGPITFNYTEPTCKLDNFYILFTFLLITILLLIIVSIHYYFYHIKHRSKQKQYYHCNNK